MIFVDQVACFAQPVAGVAGAASRIMVIPSDVRIDVVDAEHKRLEHSVNRFAGEDTEFIVVIQPEAFRTLLAHQAGIERLVEISVHRAGIDVDVRGLLPPEQAPKLLSFYRPALLADIVDVT